MLLYLHIPFCNSKCNYCAFASFTDKFSSREKYLKALLIDLEYEIERFELKKYKIQSLYIGGGTPSTMNIQFYEAIFSKIEQYLEPNAEITIEANPNLSHNNWLKDIYSLGVNRISFGVQSFNEIKLKELGRNHTKKEIITTINDAYKSGFDNISIDLIYDFYQDTKKLILSDIDSAFKLPINHISAYSLIIEDKTAFQGKHHMKIDGDGFGEFVIGEIESRGFKQYEIANFGLNKSKHNSGYWEYKNYMGVGYGAVGFLLDKRFYSNDNFDKYLQNPSNKRVENLSQLDIKVEKVLLGLRSEIGFDICLLDKNEKLKAEILEKNFKLNMLNDRYYNKNFLLADEISKYILF